MNKKFKYTSLVAAGAVTLGLVGGTLAWFTSTDSVTNNFATVGNNQANNNGSSIQIAEVFAGSKDNPIVMTPGRNENKDVQVKNIDNYDQFIKTKITLDIKVGESDSKNYEIQKKSDRVFTVKSEDYKELELHFTDYLSETADPGKWVFNQQDGYFYYIGQVAGGSHTNTLLDSVKLTEDANEKYKNLTFDVIVEAKGIQTTYNAAVEEWNLAGTGLEESFSANVDTGEAKIGVITPTSPAISSIVSGSN